MLGTAMLCEETYPMLLLNARGQPITLRNFEDRPLVFTIEEMSDFNDFYTWVAEDQPLLKPLAKAMKEHELQWGSEGWFAALKDLPKPWGIVYEYLEDHNVQRFGSLGIDSITQVQRIARNKIVDYNTFTPDTVPNATKYPQFQSLLAMMMGFADHHFDLPCHVFMTALSRRNEVPTLGITQYYPFLWGQSALEVASYAELVGRLVPVQSLPTQKLNTLKKREGTHDPNDMFNILLTRGGQDYIAKWQGPMNPPDYIVNPTVQKIIDTIKQ
jgi:hypothetical protein